MIPVILLLIFHNILEINGQTVVNRTYIQPATALGSSSVCVGSSVTFNCTIKVFITNIGFIIPDAIWRRDGVVITASTPRHTLLRTQHEGRLAVTGVMVDNTTLDDNDIVYTCTASDAPDNFASNVTLSVVGGLPFINSITYDDTSCSTTYAIVSWNYSSDPLCGPISHDVTISPSDGVMMIRITDTFYNFTGLIPGTSYTVTVAGINNAGTGESSTVTFHVPTNCQSTMSGITPTATTTMMIPTITMTLALDQPDAIANESDDELCTGAAVVISTVVIFIITLVVTVLITYIITSLYYKYRYELKDKAKVDDDKKVNTKQKDPNGSNITMDTNPAYAATIKMDTNPAYATIS